MSCVNYRMMDSSRGEQYPNGIGPVCDGRYTCYNCSSTSHTPRHKTSDRFYPSYSGNYVDWMVAAPTPYNSTSSPETPREDRQHSELNTRGVKRPYVYEPLNYQQPVITKSMEKVQAKLRYFEDSNDLIQSRNKSLINENAELKTQLEVEASNSRQLQERIRHLKEELTLQRDKLAEELAKQMRKASSLRENGTSTDVEFDETAVQVWSVCRGCRQKLEGCVKEAVTITKSELDVLEKDMQTLKDAVVAREKAWDEAMEREQNYRLQLARLTGETITIRHLYESQQDEMQTLKDELEKKDLEARSLQKETLCLNKIVAKMNKRLRDWEEGHGARSSDINDKEQKYIEEITRRIPSAKTKQKGKFSKKNYSPSSQESPRGTISPGCASDSVPEN